MLYLIIFAISSGLSIILTPLVRRLALFLKIQDLPREPRKTHKQPVPLLGGLAVYLAFFAAAFSLIFIKIIPAALAAPLGWLLYAGAIIVLGGFFDDKYSLPPRRQIWFPLAAIAVAVIFGGIRIHLITNPAGGFLYLAPAVSLILSFLWLLIITYTTKILDGLDGLVSGTVFLGGASIFLFSTLSKFKETGLPYLALALAGVFAGFLIFNKYPAKIFLGEGGSLFAGFILGALAILTGAKIAVTLMVLALPLIDLAAVIVKRITKKKSIFSGDRLHLHYLLVDRGWKPKNVVYLYWIFAAVLGAVAVLLPSGAKVAMLAGVMAVFFLIDVLQFKEK